MKSWEKTKLSSEFDLDESMLDKDFEEEFLLNEQMEELMLDDEMSAELNDSCPNCFQLNQLRKSCMFRMPTRKKKSRNKVESLIFFHKNNKI